MPQLQTNALLGSDDVGLLNSVCPLHKSSLDALQTEIINPHVQM